MCREILSWAKKVYLGNSLAGVRKDIPRKNRLLLYIFQKGRGGFNPNSKVLGECFWGFLLDIFQKGGGG